MKTLLTRIGIAGLVCLLLFSGCVYLVMANSRIRPEIYVGCLVTDQAMYASLESVEDDKFLDRLYYYQDSECVAGISQQRLMPNTANDQNLVPAFKYDGDTFIITYKWVNFSRGLAISKRDDFVAKLQSLDRGLTAWPLGDNVYGWDLERDGSKYQR